MTSTPGVGSTLQLGPTVTVKAEAGQPRRLIMDIDDNPELSAVLVQGLCLALLGRGGELISRQ